MDFLLPASASQAIKTIVLAFRGCPESIVANLTCLCASSPVDDVAMPVRSLCLCELSCVWTHCPTKKEKRRAIFFFVCFKGFFLFFRAGGFSAFWLLWLLRGFLWLLWLFISHPLHS